VQANIVNQLHVQSVCMRQYLRYFFDTYIAYRLSLPILSYRNNLFQKWFGCSRLFFKKLRKCSV